MKTSIGRNTRYLATISVSVLLLAGCAGGLEDVDRRTDDLVRERSASLLGASVRPELASKPLDGAIVENQVDRKIPPTNDPATGQLRLTPADEARDVAARLAGYGVGTQGGTPLDLNGALKQAQLTAREYLAAQDAYLLAAINLLIERHLWDPRFFDTTTIQASANGINGDYTATLALINDLRASQRLPNGGVVEAAFLWTSTQQLVTTATGRYIQSSSIILNADIPLMRGAGLAAREELTQQERNLVYAARTFEDARRTLLVQIARDYFDLLQQQRTMENQQRALDLLKNLEKRTSKLVEAGRLAEFQKNIAANDVLRATSLLASQRERFILSLDRFKLRLGLDVSAPITIKGEIPVLPEPDITPEQAAVAALDYRLDLQTQRDRREDAQRAVLVAQNKTLADVNLFGNATLPTDPDKNVGGLGFGLDENSYTAGVRVGWPLDRQNEKMAVRAAQLAAERARRDTDNLRDTVVIESRAAAREIDRARFSLTLAEQAVKINLRRAKEQELKADEVTAQEIVDTANALRDAENQRDQSVSDLRNAVLDYLLTTGQLRVSREGLLLLPGETEAQPEVVLPPAQNQMTQPLRPQIDAPVNEGGDPPVKP